MCLLVISKSFFFLIEEVVFWGPLLFAYFQAGVKDKAVNGPHTSISSIYTVYLFWYMLLRGS